MTTHFRCGICCVMSTSIPEGKSLDASLAELGWGTIFDTLPDRGSGLAPIKMNLICADCMQKVAREVEVEHAET